MHLKRFERILFVFLWRKGEGTGNFACWRCSMVLAVGEAGEVMARKSIVSTQKGLAAGKASWGSAGVPG